ncbi:MAG: alpha/beta fold hydrolase, partial [Pseudomonadota bacterium]
MLLVIVVASFWVFERDLPASLVDTRYSNPASQFLTLPNGSRIHYRDQGVAEAPAIVLLHGSNASLHTWEPWVERLGDRYRIVTIDLPGHGLTGAVPDQQYTTAAFMATVTSVTQHLRLPPFVLGGNSMGGGVTWRYAAAYPQQVRAMILVDASGPRDWSRQAARRSGEERPPLAFRLLRYEWFRTIGRYLDLGYLTGEGLRASYADKRLVDEALIDRYYNLNMRAGTRAATLLRATQPRDNDQQGEQALR